MSLEVDLYREVLLRIAGLASGEAKILLEVGFTLNFAYDDGLLLKGDLSPQDRELITKHAEGLVLAALRLAPIKKLLLSSPGLRTRTIPTPVDCDENEEFGELLETLNQDTQRLRRLHACCRVLMEAIEDAAAIITTDGVYLDCNQSFKVLAKQEMIGKTVGEVLPDMPTQEALEEALQYPGIRIYRDFTHEPIAGLSCPFRLCTVAYKDEALTLVKSLAPHLWTPALL